MHWFLGEEQSHGKRVGALKRRFKSAKVHLLMTQQNSRRISVDSLLPMPGAVAHNKPEFQILFKNSRKILAIIKYTGIDS